MAVRIMAAYYYVGRDKAYTPTNFNSWTKDTYGPIHGAVGYPIGLINQHVDVRRDHATLIRTIGQASTVLLKNDGALPLTGHERYVGIFGEDAGSNSYGVNGCVDHSCDNGTLATGWGSGSVDFPYLVTPEQAIQSYVISQTRGLVSAITDNNALQQAGLLARQVDVALVFVNADSGEGFLFAEDDYGDRNNLTLWKQGEELIANVSSLNNNTIVVIHSIGAVNMSSWYENDNITAILWAGLPGQESGNAIVDVLYGKVNPGGKLPFTIARNREDYGTNVLYEPNNGDAAPQQDFSEGVFIDYRHFDANNIEPIYEFGFGLSYTTFNYSDLVITQSSVAPYVPTSGQSQPAPTYGGIDNDTSVYLAPDDGAFLIPNYVYPFLNSTDLQASSNATDYGLPTAAYVPEGATNGSPYAIHPAGGAPGGNSGLYDVVAMVTASVANTGSIAGDEVVQLYVSLGPNEPPRVLRGFDRLTIQPGLSGTFRAELTRKDISTWDVTTQNWVPVGDVTIYVGSSSRKLPLQGALSVEAAR